MLFKQFQQGFEINSSLRLTEVDGMLSGRINTFVPEISFETIFCKVNRTELHASFCTVVAVLSHWK